MSKQIIVTGGAGFIGSHLCSALLSQGHHVTAVDNLLTSQQSNLTSLISSPKFTLLQHDITHPIPIQSADQIYNLACPASPMDYQLNAIQTIQTNVMGAVNVLNLAASCQARILQASTSEVYGTPQVHPQTESYWGNVNPIGPRSCYDEGKRVAETLFMDYHRQRQVDIRIARIFNTYGPRMRPCDGRVVSNFIVQCLSNKPITLYGNGNQTRSFCYVDDLVSGLILLMNTETATVSTPINLGNPHEISISELAHTIKQLTKSQSVIQQQSLPEDDPPQRQPDISNAQQHLQWTPSTDLLTGLQQTIAYFSNSLS